MRVFIQAVTSASTQATDLPPRLTGLGNVPWAMRTYTADLLKPRRSLTWRRRRKVRGGLFMRSNTGGGALPRFTVLQLKGQRGFPMNSTTHQARQQTTKASTATVRMRNPRTGSQ